MKRYLLFCLLIVIITYSFSLNRSWQFFDERAIYNEGLLPIPVNFSEFAEVISTYGFNHHFDSQNTFFSNIINIRSAPLGEILKTMVAFFLKKNAFLYHLLQLFIHVVNTALVWMIFYTLFKFKSLTYKTSLLFSSLLSLIWSLHPLNIEAILLITNWNSLLTHTFSFGFFLYVLNKVCNNCSNTPKHITVIITLLYVVSLFLTEYSYILLPVLLFTSLAFSFKQKSLNLCKPFIYGLILFAFLYLIKFFIPIQSISGGNQLFSFSLERFLFLSPQIFLHFLELFLYPKSLSLHQTNLIYFSDSTLSPYSIFAALTFLSFILTPALLFIFLKKEPEKSYFYLITYAFVFSLFPFLHIISPTYCLIAERYCYFPLFLFIFWLSVSLLNIFKTRGSINTKICFCLLFSVLLILQIRTIFRFIEWKDTVSLYKSALKCSKNEIYKGQINSILSYYFQKTRDIAKSKSYAEQSINELNLGIVKLSKQQLTKLPKTLINYGLDPISQIITCAFSIAESKLNVLNKSTEEVLNFYEPFIKTNISYAGASQLNLYAKLLQKVGRETEAENILNFAYKKYPFSPFIIYTLSNLYLSKNELSKASILINSGYNLYPSYPRMLLRMIKLADLKKDYLNLAKYEYLLGLRMHSKIGYQKACQLYLILKKIDKASLCLKKLSMLDKNDPITLLLRSKYEEISNILNK